MNMRPRSYQIIVDILLLVNEDNGEVVGRLKKVDKKISVQEDPMTWECSHEKE